MTTMNLTEKKEQLLHRRKQLEIIKQEAHDAITAINAKIRKLDTIIAHAGEALKDEPETEDVILPENA